MVRVLYFVDRLLWGGIQSLCYDIVNHADPAKLQIDILTLDDGKSYELEDILKGHGVKVFKLKNIWLSSPKDFFPYLKALESFFCQHNNYNAVHMNSSSKNVFVLYYAKKVGIPVRIAHSHNLDYQSSNIIWKLLGDVLKFPLRKVATNYLACSELAGEWMFGKKAVRKKQVKIIKNAISASDFVFNQKWREELRKELGVENKLVVGCIGRFVAQKNHKFLVEIIYELKKKHKNICLLLIGSGGLERKLKEQIHYLDLDDNVIFLGFRADRNKWLSAMDIFVLTSSFEGLGIVLIEAQAAGLLTFAPSESIPNEARISPLLSLISLKKSSAEWAEKILINYKPEREDMLKYIQDAGYDMNQVVEDLRLIYSQEG